MAKVHVMFHYECALPQTNTFVNDQTTLLLQAQASLRADASQQSPCCSATQSFFIRRRNDSSNPQS